MDSFTLSMEYIENVAQVLEDHRTVTSDLEAIHKLIHTNGIFFNYLELDDGSDLKQQLEAQYTQFVAMRQLVEDNFYGLEDYFPGKITLRYLWDSLKKLARTIIDTIVKFFVNIFSKRAKMLNKITAYVKKFEAYGISPTVERQQVSVVPCDVYLKQLGALQSAGYLITMVMDEFEASGRVDLDALRRNKIDEQLTTAGFVFPTNNTPPINITVDTETLKPMSGKLGTLGWTKNTIILGARDLTHVLSDGAFDSTNKLEKTLKKSMVDKLQDHVVDQQTNDLYRDGIRVITGLSTGYGTLVMAMANRYFQIAEIANRFPDTQ